MLRRIGFLGLGVAGLIAAVAVGCGSSDSASSGGTGGSGGSGGSDDAGADAVDETTADGGTDGDVADADPLTDAGAPPGPPANGATPDGTEDTVFAVDKLYLGYTDREGNNPGSGWRDIGYNLDQLISTPKSANHCKPQAGANPANVKADGTNGIDNSFGANIMPIIIGLASDAEDKVNESLTNGSFTLMIKADKLGAQANYTGIAAALYAGGNFSDYNDGGTPLFDGTDTWPVVYELLDNGDITKPKVTFPSSYVVDNTWVSGTKGTINLSIAISGYALDLTIENAYITQELAADRKSGTNGTIAGVLNTETLISGLQKIAGRLSPSLCSGSTFDSIAQQIRQASDIMADGTNGDPSKTCDGISVGLGFDTKTVHLGAVTAPATPGTDPCGDGG